MTEIDIIIVSIGSIASLVCLILFLSSKKYISKSLSLLVILILSVFSVVMQIDDAIIVIAMSVIPISIINIAVRKLSNSPISLLMLSVSAVPFGMSLSQKIVVIDALDIYFFALSIGIIACAIFVGMNTFSIIKNFDRDITKTKDIVYFQYMNLYTIIPILATLLTTMISVFAITSALLLASPILYFRRQKKNE